GCGRSRRAARASAPGRDFQPGGAPGGKRKTWPVAVRFPQKPPTELTQEQVEPCNFSGLRGPLPAKGSVELWRPDAARAAGGRQAPGMQAAQQERLHETRPKRTRARAGGACCRRQGRRGRPGEQARRGARNGQGGGGGASPAVRAARPRLPNPPRSRKECPMVEPFIREIKQSPNPRLGREPFPDVALDSYLNIESTNESTNIMLVLYLRILFVQANAFSHGPKIKAPHGQGFAIPTWENRAPPPPEQ